MSTKNRTILVVEDEKPLMSIIEEKLTAFGYEVVTARTAVQAKDYLEEGVDIDAVWLDHYLLGKETGLDLLSDLRDVLKEKQIPIFVVSNTATEDKKITYMQLGVEKYYIKSEHKLEEIVNDINQYLNSRLQS